MIYLFMHCGICSLWAFYFYNFIKYILGTHVAKLSYIPHTKSALHLDLFGSVIYNVQRGCNKRNVV